MTIPTEEYDRAVRQVLGWEPWNIAPVSVHTGEIGLSISQHWGSLMAAVAVLEKDNFIFTRVGDIWDVKKAWPLGETITYETQCADDQSETLALAKLIKAVSDGLA